MVIQQHILLDYSFQSKVADFGLSRLGMRETSSHISTAPQGIPGYVESTKTVKDGRGKRIRKFASFYIP